VYVLNLSGNATTKIIELQVAHELAGDGEVVATSIDGVFYVLRNGETPGYIAGNITVAQYNGQIHCLGMRNLTVTGTGPHTGSITVDGYYSHATSFKGPFEGPAEVSIEIGQQLFGSISMGGDCSGALSVGALWADSDITVKGALSGGLTVGYPMGGPGTITAGSRGSRRTGESFAYGHDSFSRNWLSRV
jgi:hypothetical protein